MCSIAFSIVLASKSFLKCCCTLRDKRKMVELLHLYYEYLLIVGGRMGQPNHDGSLDRVVEVAADGKKALQV